MTRRDLLIPVVLVALLLAVLWPSMPAMRRVPPRDSGAFLYIGQQILQGQQPYRDLWDHKLPLIFYLNALGLALTGGSIWGVYVLEAAFMAAAVILSYAVLRRAFGGSAAALGTAAWVITLVFLYEGNQVENFGLAFQFGALYLFTRAEARGRYGRLGLAMGVLMALALLLRPTMVGIWLAIALYLLIRSLRARRWMDADLKLMPIGVGLLAVLLAVLIVIAASGLFTQFWDEAITFNGLYAGNADWGERAAVAAAMLGAFSKSGLALLMVTGWGIALRRFITSQADMPPLVGVAVIALPLEILLAAASGRQYAHYYTSVLPAAGILVGYAGRLIESPSLESRPVGTPFLASAFQPGLWCAALIAGMLVLAGGTYADQLTNNPQISASRWQPVELILTLTQPGDTVLMWGAEPSYNFLTGRRTPTRYLYNYPLLLPGYANAERYQQFIDDLSSSPPGIIIDTALNNRLTPPLDAEAREQWRSELAQGIRVHLESDDIRVPPEMDVLFNYIASHYTRIGVIGGWPVYKRNDYELRTS